VPEDLEGKHVPHKGRNTAYHIPWTFRREALIWNDSQPVRANFFPFGTQLKNWLLRQPWNLPVLASADRRFSNPYTNDASALASIFTFVVNDGDALSKGMGTLSSYEAECRRVRLLSEKVLYAARLCEAFIKQLLYCTDFSEETYRGSALGSLLSKDCRGCRSSKGAPHRLSLLGSLAHHYGLCHTYEGCLEGHITAANRRRELESAHSGVGTFAHGENVERRRQFNEEFTRIGNNLVHMLSHISEIEVQMLLEVENFIRERRRL